jgi:hypothetical protein
MTNDFISISELEEMQALWEKTTQGRWAYDDGITSITPPDPEERGKPQSIETFENGMLVWIADVAEPFEQADRNGPFIAKAHQHYPRLIAECKRLMQLLHEASYLYEYKAVSAFLKEFPGEYPHDPKHGWELVGGALRRRKQIGEPMAWMVYMPKGHEFDYKVFPSKHEAESECADIEGADPIPLYPALDLPIPEA